MTSAVVRPFVASTSSFRAPEQLREIVIVNHHHCWHFVRHRARCVQGTSFGPLLAQRRTSE